MEAYKLLKKFDQAPVTHQVLTRELIDYKRPNDKISSWVKKGLLIPLSRGIYTVSNEVSERLPDRATIANLLYGPSYISLEYALSLYGAIPERVEEVTSVTVKRSTVKHTPLGRYSYTRIPHKWYSAGIRNEELSPGRFSLIASPEKALCDTVVCTRNLQFRSLQDAEKWMIDMRLDEDFISNLNFDEIKNNLDAAPKQQSLSKLIKVLSK